LKCDLARPEERKAVFARLSATLEGSRDRRPLLLVNNAGFGLYGEARAHAPAEELALLETNVSALVELTSVLMPELLRRGGAVVNVASTAAFQPTPYLATYGASKAFVLNWTLALGEELRPLGVHALALCPGPTRTDFFRRAGLAEGVARPPFGQSSEAVVDALLDALARRRRFVVSGFANRLLTDLSCRLPKGLCVRLAARAIGRYRREKGPDRPPSG